jgi:wyosine [tRNA(Phe)-imidazoG37] synthetase (radical SAM superfamily)
VNLLGIGQKVCSFNCPYCDLGPTELRLNKIKDEAVFPKLEVAEAAIREAFQKIHTMGPVVDGITISGNGEPTLHPDFAELVKHILNARDLWMPGKPVSILTNGAGLDTRKIADAVNLLDNRLVKIDAGSEKLFKIVNAPLSRTNLARVLTGARKLKDVIVQSLFFEGTISNTSPADIDEWLEVIAMMRPKAVHIYGLTRKPAVDGLKRCDQDTLYAIASRLERKTQIKAIVTP